MRLLKLNFPNTLECVMISMITISARIVVRPPAIAAFGIPP